MGAVAPAPETFKTRADRALVNREAGLSRVLSKQGYLVYDDRLEYLIGVLVDSRPSSLEEANAVAALASREFAQKYVRTVKGHQLVGATYHQLVEKYRSGTPLPTKSEADEVNWCLIDIVSSGAWQSTLDAIATGEISASPSDADTSLVSTGQLVEQLKLTADYTHKAFANFAGVKDHQLKNWQLRGAAKWDATIRDAAQRWLLRTR